MQRQVLVEGDWRKIPNTRGDVVRPPRRDSPTLPPQHLIALPRVLDSRRYFAARLPVRSGAPRATACRNSRGESPLASAASTSLWGRNVLTELSAAASSLSSEASHGKFRELALNDLELEASSLRGSLSLFWWYWPLLSCFMYFSLFSLNMFFF